MNYKNKYNFKFMYKQESTKKIMIITSGTIHSN